MRHKSGLFAIQLRSEAAEDKGEPSAWLEAEQRIWREWPSDLRMLADSEILWSAF